MKNSREAVQKRQADMLSYIKRKGTATVTELADLYHITSATVRRDLTDFEARGYVCRSFGGADWVESVPAAGKTRDQDTDQARIDLIAGLAAAMIRENDTVFMNSSSTALRVLQFVGDTRFLCVTNNGKVPMISLNPYTEILLTGGTLCGNKKSLVGETAVSAISRVTASKCIIGVSGISAADGITSTIQQETPINHLMLSRCNGPRIVVAAGSKVGIRQNFFSGPVSDIDILITDSTAPEDQLKALSDAGVEILLADR